MQGDGMATRITTVAFLGIEAVPVDVQVQISPGLPRFNIVGLPDKAVGAIPGDMLERFMVLGELALDGRVSPVTGILPAAIAANARDLGIICPAACGAEAAWAGENIDIVAIDTLFALVNHLAGRQMAARPQPIRALSNATGPDLADIRGQEVARRALEVAAAGGHNFLCDGPSGRPHELNTYPSLQSF
jgi:magnesium chelatase family protein